MHRTKRIRENTAGVMQRVDKFHLQLQNLRYEVMHLEKEVTKCLQFRSADEDVQLVPVQEFNAGKVTLSQFCPGYTILPWMHNFALNAHKS